jgi:hypothetical protein
MGTSNRLPESALLVRLRRKYTLMGVGNMLNHQSVSKQRWCQNDPRMSEIVLQNAGRARLPEQMGLLRVARLSILAGVLGTSLVLENRKMIKPLLNMRLTWRES